MTTIEVHDAGDLLIDAQVQGSPAYALGKRLAELHPGRAMIEGEIGQFHVERYRDAKHCTMRPRADLFTQLESHWGADHGIWRTGKNGWWTIAWDGSEFELVVVRWPGKQYGENAWFCLLGDSTKRCDELYEAVCRWNHDVRGEVLVFRDGCFQKSKALHEAIAGATFDQLVLNGDLKAQIRGDFSHFLSSRAAYDEAGVPWKRGALLVGPPGNGKTLCVKALVNELAIPCLYIQSFQPREYNTAQACIDEVFKRARSTTPCILVLEDIDALLVEGTRSFFLNALDGFAANTGIVTLATTNHPERLDPSIIDRPSRFDRKYHFELPGLGARTEYVTARNARLRASVQLGAEACAQVAERTDEFSFAYLQELFVSSLMRYMSTPGKATDFLPVVLEQIAQLRDQLTSATPPDDSTAGQARRGGRFGR